MEIYPAPQDPNWHPDEVPVETRVAEPLNEIGAVSDPLKPVTGTITPHQTVNAKIE